MGNFMMMLLELFNQKKTGIHKPDLIFRKLEISNISNMPKHGPFRHYSFYQH
jgi:hypothetical protein